MTSQEYDQVFLKWYIRRRAAVAKKGVVSRECSARAKANTTCPEMAATMSAIAKLYGDLMRSLKQK